MVSKLGAIYSDAYTNLLNSVPAGLRESIEKGKITNKIILEVFKSVIVKEIDGSILISKNVPSEVKDKKVEVTNREIGLIRKICTLHEEKSVDNRKRECKRVISESVRIVRNRDKTNKKPEKLHKEAPKQKPCSTEDMLKEVEKMFSKDSKMPDALLEIVAGYIEETPIAIADFSFKRNIPDYLKNITDLDLGDEKLDYKTFCYIAKECKNLQSLVLPLNTDDLWLKEIAESLPNLKNLILSNCHGITDTGLGHLSTMIFIEKLVMSNVSITNDGVDLIIQKLVNLKELDISICFNISDDAFKNIEQRRDTLRSLKLRGTAVSDTILIKISEEVKDLEKLDLSYCEKVSDAGINSIVTKLTRLQELTLTGCKVSDEGLAGIGNLSESLQLLDISYCENITGEFLAHVDQSFKVMTELNLEECKKFEGSNLNDKFPALVKINLTHIQKNTAEIVYNIVKTAKNLESINLNRCCINDDILITIANECPKLTSLNFNEFNMATNSGLSSIVEKCSNLTDLSIQINSNIDDEGLKSIGAHCRKLHVLNLSSAYSITDEGLRCLSKGCPDLREFRLSECPKVTDNGIIYLSQGIKNLEVLEITQFQKITSSIFNYISAWKNSLRRLYISCHSIFGPIRIDDEAFDKLDHAFPFIEQLSFDFLKIGDSSISKFAKIFPALQRLNLFSSNITDEGISYLKDLSKLSYLNLYSHRISDVGVHHALGIPRLNRLICSMRQDEYDAVEADFKKGGLSVTYN